MMRTANPALNDTAFTNQYHLSSTADGVMTLEGTVNKSGLAIFVTMAAAYTAWMHPALGDYLVLSALVGLVVSLIIIFKKHLAPTLTLVYATAEGLLLGSISLRYEALYQGVVMQAITLTFGAFFCLLMAYKSGWIKPSENFKLGLFAATGAIGVLYLVSFVCSLVGIPMNFLHNSSLLSIGISAVVVVVAALNLVLDFDFIENAAAGGHAPKYMEWYGAFGLLVTLVWLYLEILRLLAKLQNRR